MTEERSGENQVITSRVPRRVAALVTLGATLAVAWIAPTSAASAAGSGQPSSPTAAAIPAAAEPVPEREAATAIADITAPGGTGNPLAGIPPDFPKVMGYRPTTAQLANGEVVAINPTGGCSVIGGGEPFDFSTVCKAHDLGYDLLRYAHRHGDPLSTDARVAVDAKFGHDLTAQCASRYRGPETSACDAMAGTFVAGVGFNSWRQEYGPPIATAGIARTIGVIAFGVLVLYFLVTTLAVAITRMWRRRTWRRDPTALRLTLDPAAQG